MQRTKRGNPHHQPKKRRKGRQQGPLPLGEQSVPSLVVGPIEPIERARLTLHESDPITGHEETLSSLFYEYYRGYTIYSTEQGRCCMHGQYGCIQLWGRFVCFPDIEDAKTLIKRFRAEGYTADDGVERSLPPSEYVRLNWHECQRSPLRASSMQRVS